MGKFLRHGIGAAVGALLGAIVAALAGQGVEVDPGQVAEIETHLTNAATLFVTLFGYAAAEKVLKRFPSLDREGFLDRLFLKREARAAEITGVLPPDGPRAA